MVSIGFNLLTPQEASSIGIIGFLMLFKPNIWWEIRESWKSHDATEPSDFYIKTICFGAGTLTVVGIAGVVAFFLLR